MMGNSLPTPEELKTVTKWASPCSSMITNGTVETNEDATLHIGDLDMILCVK